MALPVRIVVVCGFDAGLVTDYKEPGLCLAAAGTEVTLNALRSFGRMLPA